MPALKFSSARAKWFRRTLALSFLLSASNALIAQGQSEAEEKNFHRLTISLSHTHISKGVEEGRKQWLIVPSWAIDYDYWVTSKLAFGLHNDIIIESFEIENNNEEIIERNKPFVSTLTANYKPGKHTIFILGVGGEFSDTENYAVARLGIEYGRDVFDSWEISAALIYDNKIDAYDSFALGFGISKKFFSRNGRSN